MTPFLHDSDPARTHSIIHMFIFFVKRLDFAKKFACAKVFACAKNLACAKIFTCAKNLKCLWHGGDLYNPGASGLKAVFVMASGTADKKEYAILYYSRTNTKPKKLVI